MNIRKALGSEGPAEYAALQEKERRLVAELATVRADKHLLEDAAQVYSVDLNVASDEAIPLRATG